MQMTHDQWRRLQMLLRCDEYNRDNYSSPSAPSIGMHPSTLNSTHGVPGAMSSSAKRMKLAHDDAGRESQQVRHPGAQIVPENDFIPKPLLPPSIFIDISRMGIPTEVLFQIFQSWLGPQHLSVTEITPSTLPRYQLSYNSPSNPDPLALMAKVPNLPQHLWDEYLRFRLLSWLKDTKEFEDPYTFYMSTFLLCYAGNWGDIRSTYQVPNTPCWDALNSLDNGITMEVQWPVLAHTCHNSPIYAPLSHLRGLENVKLDFEQEQYFVFFDVAVPPFNTHDTAIRGDDLYRDTLCHGAAIFLAHTKDLEIHFGDKYTSANAWYHVSAAAWCEENSNWEYKEARLRPRVCDKGVVVDWILEYAWYGNYLQHLEKISISGDVQEWVRAKWEGIFERHKVYRKGREGRGEKVNVFGVHRPDIMRIETYGKVGDEEQDGDEDEDEDGDEEDGSEVDDGSEVYDGSEAEDESGDEEMQEDVDEEEEATDLDEDGGEVEYRPQDHYPPACTCAIGCWRLRGGKVEEELPVTSSWDDYPEEVQGSWMDGVELSTVAHW